MKIKKRILCPARLRRIPGQFSWIDQRLIRDRYLQRCDHAALALYRYERTALGASIVARAIFRWCRGHRDER